MLTSEFVIVDNPLPDEEEVVGHFLLNSHLFIHGHANWCRFDMRGNLEARTPSPENPGQWPLLSMEYDSLEDYRLVFWSGSLEDSSMLLHTYRPEANLEPINFHSGMVLSRDRTRLFCCSEEGNFSVTEYTAPRGATSWTKIRRLPSTYNDRVETLLQLKLDKAEESVLGSTANGFVVWQVQAARVVVLHLPHGVRNISTRMLQSNSCMLSAAKDYVVAGVRKNLYVWTLEKGDLVKVLDAHFGRIISLEALTVGNWNSVITSSIDRTVKVWNINNIFEQVHVIDRHELQVDSISICQACGVAVTVTRGSVGVWDLQIGRLITQLADSPLGAIVTHALITPDGRYIISSESGNVLVWNRLTEQVISKQEQAGIKQLTFLEESGAKVFAISRPLGAEGQSKVTATGIARSIPDGQKLFSFEYPVRAAAGLGFKEAVVTSDAQSIVVLAADKGHREAVHVFSAKNGALLAKIPIKIPGVKEVSFLVAMPNRGNHVAMVDLEKSTILDLKTKRPARAIPRWGGICTRDGKYGLYAPSRGGLELVELKKGATVRTFIPKVAEGVFTVICMFNKTDEYVLYYHSGKKTLRVFRTGDAEMIANYRVQAELSSVESTEDGRAIILGTVDGCVSVLAIADPAKPEMRPFLANLPSRDVEWKKKLERQRATKRFRAAGSLAKLCAKLYDDVSGGSDDRGDEEDADYTQDNVIATA